MNKADFFEMRVRPGFFGWLLVVFIGIPALFSFLLPVNNGKKMAKIILTRTEIQSAWGLWNQSLSGQISPLLNSNGCFLVTLLDEKAKAQLKGRHDQTNGQGELLDMWRMPIRFEIVGTTNLVIRSAGPNRQFGNKDDIVFISASNKFVKP